MKRIVPLVPQMTALPASNYSAKPLCGRVVLIHDSPQATILSEMDLVEAQVLITNLNLAYAEAKSLLEATREDLRR